MPPNKATEAGLTRQRPGVDWSKIVLNLALPVAGVLVALLIGATEYIHQRLLAQREARTAILLISEDLDETRALADRIAVMYEGQLIGIVERGQASVEQIGLMMAGISLQEAMHSPA